jgi:DNA repair photolyase
MKVIYVERRSAVLTPSSLACLAHTPTINLTSGCAHSCIYCYARGYSTYPGQGVVYVYKNTLEKLKSELVVKRNRPEMLYFSPSSDIFQPVPELLDLAHSIIEFLFSSNIGIAFLTKGIIPKKTVHLLLDNAELVKAQIGIITPDDGIRRIFEPNAASIEIRLNQMRKLIAHGIVVEARLMPVLPGITDSKDSLDRLFYAVAAAGVSRAAVSTLFLRSAIINSLRGHVPDKYPVHDLLSLYRNSSPIAVRGGHSSVVPLPRQLREEIYNRIRQVAGKYGIEVSICGCMNPDIGGICNIGGTWPKSLDNRLQPSLFELPIG